MSNSAPFLTLRWAHSLFTNGNLLRQMELQEGRRAKKGVKDDEIPYVVWEGLKENERENGDLGHSVSMNSRGYRTLS